MKTLIALCVLLFSSTAANADIKIDKTSEGFSDVDFYGYKVTHHMGAMINHLDQFGFDTFDHPQMPDHRFFVITPALDHFYSKAVIDTRWGPVILETPARDDRYGSLLVHDMEHFGIYAETTAKEGQRFVFIREDYVGPIPKGTLIKTKSDFPLVFLRTQTFAFNADKLSDGIRRQARIFGAWEHVDLPSEKDPQAIIRWTMKHSQRYPETKALMEKAAETYDASRHKATFDYVYKYLQTGQVTDSAGMFDTIDSPTGANNLVRAAGTLLGHLGFPTHHAYYQNTPVDQQGRLLTGENGSFVLTVPYDPGVDLFWSFTRYGNDSRLPLNPADIGGNNIQAYNSFNTKPDSDGNVTITFSQEDPKDGTYWMPVTDGYYIIARYYGPNAELNGNTVHDILFKGTPLEEKFRATKFDNPPMGAVGIPDIDSSGWASDPRDYGMTAKEYIHAEVHAFFQDIIGRTGGINRFFHFPGLSPAKDKFVVSPNNDTIYSFVIVNAQDGFTLELPDDEGRFMAIQIVDENHMTPFYLYGGGDRRFERNQFESDYLALYVRTGTTGTKEDVRKVTQELQPQYKIVGANSANTIPKPDLEALLRVREAMVNEYSKLTTTSGAMQPRTDLVKDWEFYTYVTAGALGLSADENAMYTPYALPNALGGKCYKATYPPVPAKAFFSITVYGPDKYLMSDDDNIVSSNRGVVTNADGSYTVVFGDEKCRGLAPNYAYTPKDGWNFLMRAYRPDVEAFRNYKMPELKEVR